MYILHLCLCVDEVSDEGQSDKETLLLTVEALKAQLEEQTRLCKEQVSYISFDRYSGHMFSLSWVGINSAPGGCSS